MFSDLNEIESGKLLECDVCIIGAGAAGITTAREMANTGIRVILLESGGFEAEVDTQNLYKTESIGHSRSPDIITRQRYFGGSTNIWSGRCAPLSALDFQQRDWVPHSGWPIEFTDLAPYYLRAGASLGLAPSEYNESIWTQFGHKKPQPWFDQKKLTTQFWQFSRSSNDPTVPMRFGSEYREFLSKAENINVLLHANAIDLKPNKAGSQITEMTVKSLDGRVVTLKANQFVLCCGGIENARLLLASQSIADSGVGNDHDVVGRYFMEHPRGVCGIVAGDELNELESRLNLHWLDDAQGRHVFLAGATHSHQQLTSGKLLNCDISLNFPVNPESGSRALRRLVKNNSGDIDGDIFRVLRDLGHVLDNSHRRFITKQPPMTFAKQADIECHIEQAPNPDSRIQLSSQKDALGMPICEINWQLSKQEHRSIQALSRNVATEFSRLNLGRVRLDDWLLNDDADWQENLHDTAHHIGSTRMSNNPKYGVVDKNCRVHGISNLYICGSSVFPTGGCVNPTLTIVAMAIRTSETIKSTLSL